MSVDMSVPVTPIGPRVPRRESGWVPLPDAYAGFEFRFWINAPQRLWNDVSSGDDALGKAALAQLVLEHNGWVDEAGVPFPPPADPNFWELIPTELLAVLLVVSQAEMMKLPKSLAPVTRRR